MFYRNKKILAPVFVFVSVLLSGSYVHKASDVDLVLHPSPVQVKTYKLSARESSKAFGRNLIACKYQPIMLTIYNDSDELLFFRASSMNLPLEDATTILHTVQYPVVMTTCATAAFSALYFWPAIIPSVGLGVWMFSRNRRLEKNIRASILEPDMSFEIFPYERITKTMFVKTNIVPECFSLHFFNAHQKTFVPYTCVI